MDDKDKGILKKRTVLGRGLSALLADSETVNQHKIVTENTIISASINEIAVENIEVNPYQPRTTFEREALEELAESIKLHGIIQPVTVRQLAEDSYQLISGERRLQASKLAGLKAIPAYIRTANDQEMLEMALIENIQREELDAIEIATSYQRLLAECNLKQEELGDRVGKKRSTVNNYLRLLKLPPDIQAGLKLKKLSMGHARALINIDDIGTQLLIYKKIQEEDWSVRKVEDYVRSLATTKTASPTKPNKPATLLPEIHRIQTKLTSHFGTKVAIKQDGNKGEIKIPFVSIEDFNRILELLNL
jgi:ParB family transcriptional regulator, chromosome partitioning protein